MIRYGGSPMKCGAIILISVVSVLLACGGCGNDEGALFRNNLSLYTRVLERIQKGNLKTEGEKGIRIPWGAVRLPESAFLPHDSEAASAGGEIYVSRPGGGQLIVVFKTWRGKGFNMEGFLYAAKPIQTTDTVRIGPIKLSIERQMNQHWYRVSYRLD